MNKAYQNKKKLRDLNSKITSESWFAIFLGLLWANHTLVDYFRAVLLRIPYVTYSKDFIVFFIFAIVAIFSLPYMARRIDARLVLVYIVIVTIYLCSIVIFPENRIALEENAVRFLLQSLPLIFVGVCIDVKKQYRLLYYISLIAVISRFIHVLIEPSNVLVGDMQRSYFMLPHVCLVVVSTLSRKNVFNISVSLMGIFSIISFGTRGPVLCLLLLVIIYMLVFQKMYKHIWFFLFVLSVVFGLICFYNEIIQLLSSLFKQVGMNTRIFDLIQSGNITESSGRKIIQKQLLEAVFRNPFGYGIAGDRFLAGSYSHNLLIEFWVSYGILVGSIMFIVPIIFTAKLMIQRKYNRTVEDNFILVLIASSYIKLFLSGTYLTESLLYLLIGVLLSVYAKEKRKAENSVDLI